MTSYSFVINFPSSSFSKVPSISDSYTRKNHPRRLHLTKPSSPQTRPPRVSAQAKATSAAMEAHQSTNTSSSPPIKLLFVEMGVGYDQHGQDITAAAMRACRDAISSNSIPAFRRGSIPGVSFDEMKLQITLGVPHSLQQSLDIERVKSVFPYGKIVKVEVVDGGLICSSGVYVEEMGDKNDDCYMDPVKGPWQVVFCQTYEEQQPCQRLWRECGKNLMGFMWSCSLSCCFEINMIP